MDGIFPSLLRRRAWPGAATSTPHTHTGSDANTTNSPSCDTLKLKFGAIVGSGRGECRNGLRPFVRRISMDACGAEVTKAHAARCRSLLTSARFLSGM